MIKRHDITVPACFDTLDDAVSWAKKAGMLNLLGWVVSENETGRLWYTIGNNLYPYTLNFIAKEGNEPERIQKMMHQHASALPKGQKV